MVGLFFTWTDEGMIIVFDLTLYEYIQDIKTTFIANLCLTYTIFYNWAHVVSKWSDKIILRNEILIEILWNLRKTEAEGT